MSSDPSPDTQIRTLLQAAQSDGTGAVNQLVPLIYDELRIMARRHLRGDQAELTLQTTALVHEAYLKLAGDDQVATRGRAYFFGAAARAMRQVLIDRARRRKAAKRGAGVDRITFGGQDAAVDDYAVELLELDSALQRLAQLSPRQAKVVECRYFAGMNVDEVAEALNVSKRTVVADWAIARAWLLRELDPAGGPTQGGAD